MANATLVSPALSNMEACVDTTPFTLWLETPAGTPSTSTDTSSYRGVVDTNGTPPLEKEKLPLSTSSTWKAWPSLSKGPSCENVALKLTMSPASSPATMRGATAGAVRAGSTITPGVDVTLKASMDCDENSSVASHRAPFVLAAVFRTSTRAVSSRAANPGLVKGSWVMLHKGTSKRVLEIELASVAKLWTPPQLEVSAEVVALTVKNDGGPALAGSNHVTCSAELRNTSKTAFEITPCGNSTDMCTSTRAPTGVFAELNAGTAGLEESEVRDTSTVKFEASRMLISTGAANSAE